MKHMKWVKFVGKIYDTKSNSVKHKCIITFFHDKTKPVSLTLNATTIYIQFSLLEEYLKEAGFVITQETITNNMVFTCEKNSINHFWTIFPQDRKNYCDFSFRMLKTNQQKESLHEHRANHPEPN